MSDYDNNKPDSESFFPFGELKGVAPGPPIEETPVFVDDTMADWGGKQAPDGQKNNRIRTSINTSVLGVLFVLILLGLLTVTGRAAQIQLLEGSNYAERAEGNRSRIEWLPADRGVIYDRTGIPLVVNTPRFTVTVTPIDLPINPVDKRKVLGDLAKVLGVFPRDIEMKLAEKSARSALPITVAENIKHQQAIMIDIISVNWPAVQLVRGVQRKYPNSDETMSLSHILGYEGKVTEQDLAGSDYLMIDRIGRTGLEKSYEDSLKGQHGRRRVEVDALGSRKTVIAEEYGVPGSNLMLTLDYDLQRKSEELLQEALDKNKAERGSVVVMNPNNGEILSLVSLPAFDNNLFAQGISTDDYQSLINDKNKPLFFRAVSASLPSGSTFKLIVAAAALAENIVTPNTTVRSVGGISIGQWNFPDWKYGGHGITNLAKAISESVNTYFYMVGGGYEDMAGLGVTRIIEYAKKFGLSRPTGIDLPSEGAGFLPSKEWKLQTKGERWYDGDTYHLSIGQGDILVTPLQIANMTTVFANGGTLYQPQLVKSIYQHDGTIETKQPVVISNQVISDKHLMEVRKGMRDSVLYGSSRSLSVLDVSSAGKTGTAQWSSVNNTHAWFTSFAPYEKPEIVVTVMIEEGGEGSAAAAPVARDILDYYFSAEQQNNQ